MTLNYGFDYNRTIYTLMFVNIQRTFNHMIAGHQTMNYYLPVKSVYFLMGMFKQAPA